LAFVSGLAALFTPWVFPMVPLTVSYFRNRNPSDRRAALSQALLFCAGIVILFAAIGFVATLAAGPFGAVQLSNSPWVDEPITNLITG
jgi:cytochrome c biogenesis protein CcdA